MKTKKMTFVLIAFLLTLFATTAQAVIIQGDTTSTNLVVKGTIKGNQDYGMLRVQCNGGYLDMGTFGQYFAYLRTDRDYFALNKNLVLDGGDYAISAANHDLNFATTYTQRMTILNSNGNVGIGLTVPAEKLHIDGAIRGNGTGGALKVQTQYGYLDLGPQSSSSANIYTDRATIAFNKPLLLNSGNITTYATDLNIGTSFGVSMTLLNSNGYVGINTVIPAYPLDVKGTIRATEILVQSVDNFADFVFDPKYKLPKISEVDSYIKDNGHLPNIPSASDVKEKGLNVVDMQVKLLQKVEELTLYVIDQQKKIEKLEAALSESGK